MNIVYSSDGNYFNYAMVSIASLLENNKNNNIKIYFIENNIPKEQINNLKSLVKKYNQKIEVIGLDKICKNIHLNDNFPKSAFARLFITRFIKEDKVLYLDCDTIINSDIKELYLANIEQYYVAGVQDNVEKIMTKIIGMTDDDRYINSGVLLINLKKWREDNIEEKFINFIKKFNGNVPHHDQGIINGVCKNNIKILSPKCNYMSQFFIHSSTEMKRLSNIKYFYSDSELQNDKKNIIVIHYIEKFYGRPWTKNCTHPLRNEFEKYAEIAGIIIDKTNKELSLPVRIRKIIYYKFPFSVYYIIEKLLEVKRNYVIKRKYLNHEKESINY